LLGADKNATEVTTANLHSLKIGSHQFYNVKVTFSDISHLNEGYKIKLDGLIGYQFLANQPTLISYKNNELILIK